MTRLAAPATLALLSVASALWPAGACPFARLPRRALLQEAGGDEPDEAPVSRLPAPFCAATGGAGPAEPTPETMCDVVGKVRDAFRAELKGRGRVGKAQLLGATVRLSFHDAGEYDREAKYAGGPDGCLSDTGSNAGLIEGAEAPKPKNREGRDFEVSVTLEPMWQAVCINISRADFWALAAAVAVDEAERKDLIRAGHELSLAFGRSDSRECEEGAGRLPGGEDFGLTSLEKVFERQMGLTVSDGVALIGAHTLGAVSPRFSGYGIDNGSTPWSFGPEVFNNKFYRTMVKETWFRRAAKGAADKQGQQWQIRGLPNRLMLNSDMALAFNITKDPNNLDDKKKCGGLCKCEPAITRPLVDRYLDNTAWLVDFAAAFNKMVAVGYGGSVTPEGFPDTRLGSLRRFDPSECPAAA